ncbi:uncharacterized protein [Spinacia oleracea]|uniref:Uncharacterized protein n=1 Tax=Spinacia oleracea TaxID=3562 RepID=A0A9R0J7A4_SPIOL|nr:uncharacterized protein LOC110801484 [Spinacia oleracea]
MVASSMDFDDNSEVAHPLRNSHHRGRNDNNNRGRNSGGGGKKSGGGGGNRSGRGGGGRKSDSRGSGVATRDMEDSNKLGRGLQCLHGQPSVLGPALVPHTWTPHQAFMAAMPSYMPLMSALRTNRYRGDYAHYVHEPPDVNWYMHTGATSHMTSSQGYLISYFNLSNKNGKIVGNGHMIPVRGCGHT